jgi:hypothetical protein
MLQTKTFRIGLLNLCWRAIMKMTDLEQYLRYGQCVRKGFLKLKSYTYII